MSVEPNFVKIGQNIKIMRIRKGVTQSELAKKLGISQTHMSNLEHGRVSVNLKNVKQNSLFQSVEANIQSI